MSTRVAIALMTAPNEAKAAEIARALVEERLIACANLVPKIRSIYVWEGKIADEAETLVVMKIEAAKFERIKDRILELHPYGVPEVLALDVDQGHTPYLQWVLGLR